MNETFDIEEYLAGGIRNIIDGIIKSALYNPRESLFMAKYAVTAKKASLIRQGNIKKGFYFPPFLIASITSSCNLHCKGCYARENKACSDDAAVSQLSAAEWKAVFKEAADLGVSFILLAGGEPFIRYDVLETAGEIKSVLFPVFTNGTMLNEKNIQLLDRCRNLLPIISIEGDERITDARRGSGIYHKINNVMQSLTQKGILFGTSVTVTTENLPIVTSVEFLDNLTSKGCKSVIYVEYVPTDMNSDVLTPGDAEREYMNQKIEMLRNQYSDMLFICFPGDEKKSGGCLAAGRGFFHINSHGGAEPCPFSPYSDSNVKEAGLSGAVKSHLFAALQSGNLLMDDHKGGCVLFEKRSEVEKLLS